MNRPLLLNFEEIELENKIFANEEIYGSFVILVDESGTNKGEVNKRLAISQARELNLDLIQVARHVNGMPICKYGDVGKIKFEASKKHDSKPVDTKEMMFHLNTGINDINVKKNKVRTMLQKKCMVKFGIQLKGRERAFMSAAKQLLQDNVADFRDIAKWDDLKVLDNIVFVVLKPIKEAHHVERTEN